MRQKHNAQWRKGVLLFAVLAILCVGLPVRSSEAAATYDIVGIWKFTGTSSEGYDYEGYFIFTDKSTKGQWVWLLKRDGGNWEFDYGKYKVKGTKLTLKRGLQGSKGKATFQQQDLIEGKIKWGAVKYTWQATDPTVASD